MPSLPDSQQTEAAPPAPTWQGEASALSNADQSRNQALIDTTARITGAMYVYVSLWLVITLFSGMHRAHPILVWGAAAWLGSIALVRGVVGHQLKRLLDYNPGLEHKLTVGLVL